MLEQPSSRAPVKQTVAPGTILYNIPTPITGNILFHVYKSIRPSDEENWILGQKYQYSMNSYFRRPGLEDAILCHIEPVEESADEAIYRLFYIVPYKEQHKYNRIDVSKDEDNFTRDDWSFLSQEEKIRPTSTVKRKNYVKYTREFVIPIGEAFDNPSIGELDPSGERDDVFLVHEEVNDFQEDYLNKLFKRVTRIYQTVPGPIVLSYLGPTTWSRDGSVWKTGGPGSSSQWISVAGRRWSRTNWKEVIPQMPPEAENATPVTRAWDTAEYPVLGTWEITELYQTRSNIPIGGERNSISNEGCSPPAKYVKSKSTTTITINTTHWDNSSEPLPPHPTPEGCDEWTVVSEVSNYEQRSDTSTTLTCIKYEIVSPLYSSDIDSQSGQPYIVSNELIPTYTSPISSPGIGGGTTSVINIFNPCYSERVTRSVGLPYTRSWNASAEAFFPPILSAFFIESWGKQEGGQAAYPYLSYLGPVSGSFPATVTESFYPTGSGDPGWVPTAPFITGRMSYACPYFSLSSEACLHGEVSLMVSSGTDDPYWSPHVSSRSWGATPEQGWRSIVRVSGQAVSGGVIWRRTVISPP